MAIPWLAALQLVPWSQVIEHAPKVLAKAQELLRRRGAATGVQPVPPETSGSASDPQALEPGRLSARIDGLERQVQLQRQQLDQYAQMLGELAEQNAGLIAAVHHLRRRTRWLQLGLIVLALLGLIAWRMSA